MFAKVVFYYDTDKKNKINFRQKQRLKPRTTLMNKKVHIFVFYTTINGPTT